MTAEYFDTHAHLALLKHCSADEAYARALQEGVKYMTTVSTDASNWEPNRALAHRLANVYYTVGLHPHDAKDWAQLEAPLADFLQKHSKDGKLVGVGETGLDFFYNHSERDVQIAAFEGQLELSKKYAVPLIIHCRDSFQELYGSIRKIGLGAGGGIMHCFTGNTAQAKEALDLGLYLSFSGIVTFKNAGPLREAAKTVPLNKLLVETDCPFLTPIPHRGAPNEPFYLPFTAKTISGLLGIPPEEIARRTTENARTIFKV